MTAQVLPLRRGSGRQSAAAEAVWAAQAELDIHSDEALAFVERCRVHARSLEWSTRELSPREHQHAMALLVLLDRYEIRHMPPDDEPTEAVAA